MLSVGSVGEATTTAAPTKEDKPITSETVWIIIGVGLGGLLLVLILATGNCIRINRNNRRTRYTDEVATNKVYHGTIKQL